MKKIILIISSVIFIIVLGCTIFLGSFWWIVLRDPQRPDFVQPYGYFVFGPEARVVDSFVIINWATRAEYKVNSIYFEKSREKFPDFGGEDVTVQYDATNKIYNYSAQFAIGLPATYGTNGYAPYIEPGKYTYQIWSNTADSSKQTVSPILALVVPKITNK